MSEVNEQSFAGPEGGLAPAQSLAYANLTPFAILQKLHAANLLD